MAGPFHWDEDGNHHLFVSMDSFSKRVETFAVPLLHSWRAAEFMYNDVVAHRGKLCYVCMNNISKFVVSFE